MAEYSKKTVADLQEILKSRGLPSSGKKADLVARLTEADKTADATASTEAVPAENPHTVPEPVVATEEQPVVNESETIQPEEQGQDAAAENAATAEPEEKKFALNLQASDVDAEMARRKQRAERFKTVASANADAEATETATTDTDALKALERAKRFGEGGNAIGLLDQALPSERQRGSRNKRGGGAADESSALDDSGLKKNFNKKGRFNNRKRGGPGKPTGVAKPSSSAYTNEKDKQAAEKRKQRFATG